MRSSKSRSRNKSNRNRPSGNIVNRVFDSSGPEGKVRGTPQQVIDKYNQLARDSQLSNDRVATENFQQHAEHYQRMLNEAQREQEARREEQERQNRERQAERDRERRERMERQEREANGGEGKAQPQADEAMPTVDPSEAEQPDLIVDVAEESALVETPETQPEAPKPAPKKAPRKRAPRKKAPAPAAEDAPAEAPAPEAESNDAAE
ncbi:DUF4167 domain-containing protein [Shimia sp. R9_1]|nr:MULTISPECIES: DUF4167 domain-containing protein [unclassified Shimia]MBO9396176.1 DUF4167 domain-containing protein [Shimia sp. R9_2]MBO9400682.1 DUF4167 domain-containing protein [Shimia sp. R9_3]MBO9406020.1 DUF4167 domain-containing protein [Shimia sp. R9_1]